MEMPAHLPITPARRLTLAIGAPLAIVIIGWAALSVVGWAGPGSRRVNLAVPAHGAHLSVAIGSGQIRLSPGRGPLIRLTLPLPRRAVLV